MMENYDKRLWDYANNVMYNIIKTEEHCDRFLAEITKFTADEKETLRGYWHLITYNDSNSYYNDDDVETIEEYEEYDYEEFASNALRVEELADDKEQE